MTRAEQVRLFWDERIPREAEILVLSDAAKFINRGLPKEILTVRSLQRYAAAGALGAFGGPGTAIGHYRVTRANLINFLCRQDSLVTPADIERITAASAHPHLPAPALGSSAAATRPAGARPAAPAARSCSITVHMRGRRGRKSEDQQDLFEEKKDQ
jgi:hypothetical protein